jgi:hypothetical protein
MISKEKIFNLFDTSEGIDIHDDFMDSPYAKIGMFNKIIINNKIFLQNLKHSLEKIKKEYDERNLEIYSQFVVFNRAFFYIKSIDIENTLHVDALKCYDVEKLYSTLDLSISYFEVNEEYEKCAHLFKIKNFIQSLSK